MEVINRNLRFLREKAGLTQKELAAKIKVKTPVIGSYEEGRSIPPIPTSIKIADFFKVSLDSLVLKDLKQRKEEALAGREKGVLTITVNAVGDENIELVTQKASAGYLSGYGDLDFIKELPKMSIPFLSKNNTYRAFEINGASMLPVKTGDIVIGKYLESLEKVKTGKTYILVSKNNGIVYKRVFEALADGLLLISDNSEYDPYFMPLSDILEVWAFVLRLTREEEQSDLPITYVEKIVKVKQAAHGTSI